MISNRDDSLALDIPDVVLPYVPVVLIFDEKSNQHARVNLANVQSAQPSSVAGVDLRNRVLGGVLVERQSRPGEVRVEVEQVGTWFGIGSCSLCSYKVVRLGGTATVSRLQLAGDIAIKKFE